MNLAEIPMAEASERGRIAFTMVRLNQPVAAAGGGWFLASVNANCTDFRQLTTSPHTVSGFAWSPDGSRIAYTLAIYSGYAQTFGDLPHYESLADIVQGYHEFQQKMMELASNPEEMQRSLRIDYQLCLIHADGSEGGYFEDFYAAQFVWSLDGRQFALIVSEADGYMLGIMNADGSDLRRLSPVSRTSLGGFSPDGSRLLLGDKALYTLRLDGTDRQEIPIHGVEPFFPSWSPDGRRVAFFGYGEETISLYTIRTDGTDQHTLMTTTSVDEMPYAWSPDSQQIALVAYPEDNKDFRESEALWIVPADGSTAPRKLAEIYGDVFHDELRASGPAWSPDGRRIAYFGFYDPDASSYDIYLINPDGSDLRRVTTDGLLKANLAWQPGS